jgi:hypothetical protein
MGFPDLLARGRPYDRDFPFPEFQDEANCTASGIFTPPLGWIYQVGTYLHTFYLGPNGGQAFSQTLKR